MKTLYYLMAMILLLPQCFSGQAVIDSAFTVPINVPAYSSETGPEIFVDNAHHNYHTADGRYMPFANVLRADGYRISGTDESFSKDMLSEMKIVVIANSLHERNVSNWSLPVHSAFTEKEITALKLWVMEGGSLLLIADHMPFAGAAADLAAAFGITFTNCFAMDNRHRSAEIFTRSSGTLSPAPITEGEGRSVDTVATFTGSAFKIPAQATEVIGLDHYTLLSPDVAWQFEDNTPFESGEEFSQLATMEFGKGRLVISGEAAMFTSQIAAGQHIGLSHPAAVHNIQLLLNIIHWLDRH